MKYDIEQKDLLRSIEPETLRALQEVFNECLKNLELNVLQLDLSQPNSKEQLFVTKARADGARLLIAKVNERLKSLRK